METTNCPHCGANTSVGQQYCEQCGMALPTAQGGQPRVVEGSAIATSAVGQDLQTDELAKKSRSAWGALLAVAILQVIGGIAIYALLNSQGGPAAKGAPMVLFVMLGIGALFFGLAIWARKDPFPAAIAGLVVFVTLHLIEAVMDPPSLVRGIIVKVIVIVVLVNAIKAGAQHREILNQQRANQARL